MTEVQRPFFEEDKFSVTLVNRYLFLLSRRSYDRLHFFHLGFRFWQTRLLQ